MAPARTCECGCGETTRVALHNNARLGWVSGEPIRFVIGHHMRRPAEERFWENVEKTETCWLWKGVNENAHGYGQFSAEGRPIGAHRFAYELLVGPIPDGLTLDHLCRVPRCVNPSHLEPVTHRENTLRGIGPSALNARKTHCLRGHAFDDANTYWYADGRRNCRTCKRVRQSDRDRKAA